MSLTLTYTHFLDVTTDKAYNDTKTGCGLFAYMHNRSVHRERVDCPACRASEAFLAQGMEDALAASDGLQPNEFSAPRFA